MFKNGDRMVDDPETPPATAHTGDQAAPVSESAWVILASFENRHAAEHTVSLLGHDFRHQALNGNAAAFVVTHNRDGSFKLRQSRELTTRGLTVAATKVTAFVFAGLLGARSALRGAKTARHAAHERQSHVGRDDKQLADLLDRLGPHAAGMVFVCTDQTTEQAVAALAEKRGSDSTHHSRTEFLALLDQLGGSYDWIRPAVTEPSAKKSKRRRFHHKR
jgi:uncharacterized membrane protein